MTDAQKVQKLATLLDQLIFRLEFTQFDSDCPERASKIVQQINEYRQQMSNVLDS